jgi:hypothetical protein
VGLEDKPKTGLVMLPDIFTATPHNLELVISLASRYRVPPFILIDTWWPRVA